MINFKGGKFVDETERVRKAVRRAGFNALRRLGFLIRKVAQASILREPGPSEPGTPPHTHRRLRGKRKGIGQLPGSILYDTEDNPERVIIGPSINIVGTSAKPHEHGGDYKGQSYESRPFMGPALAEEIGELPGLLIEQLTKV